MKNSREFLVIVLMFLPFFYCFPQDNLFEARIGDDNHKLSGSSVAVYRGNPNVIGAGMYSFDCSYGTCAIISKFYLSTNGGYDWYLDLNTGRYGSGDPLVISSPNYTTGCLHRSYLMSDYYPNAPVADLKYVCEGETLIFGDIYNVKNLYMWCDINNIKYFSFYSNLYNKYYVYRYTYNEGFVKFFEKALPTSNERGSQIPAFEKGIRGLCSNNGTIYLTYSYGVNSSQIDIYCAKLQLHENDEIETSEYLVVSNSNINLEEIPSIEINRNTGTLFVAYNKNTSNNSSTVMIERSSDGCASWDESSIKTSQHLKRYLWMKCETDYNGHDIAGVLYYDGTNSAVTHMEFNYSKNDGYSWETPVAVSHTFVNNYIPNTSHGNYHVGLDILTDAANNRFKIFPVFCDYDYEGTHERVWISPFALSYSNDNEDNFIKEKSKIKQVYNYPNPFNPVTNIHFEVIKAGFVSLKIFDISGREIKSLVNETKVPGVYDVKFDGSNFSSGVYFYRLISGNESITKRMILTK